MIQMTIDNNVYVTAETLAKKLGCTAHWIRIKAGRNEIPFLRMGGRLWFPLDMENIALPRKAKKDRIVKQLIDSL